ncbi:MAG: SusC/RagA family TonB-linked outer membrane protein [Bacteroidales bacterium]|nr:SusC/RagA family TonB-linked outer membrane protein [Bacteroidales bacterium]
MKENIISRKLQRIPVIILLILCLLPELTAQDTTIIRGIIKNGAGQPVSDVSVGVEGSQELPSYTNARGEFTIKATSTDVYLNVNPSSGYKPKRVFLNDRTQLTVYLSANEVLSGDDPVAIISQERKRRDIVATFDALDVNDIQLTPSFSIGQYLQGRVSGMQVINRSGNPVSGTTSFIRGVSSSNTSSQPLYVVDGIPVSSFGLFNSNLEGFAYNPLLSLNPFDVSRVTVVKDPIATAAYGSKASNGVIFIKTLDPSTTQTSIDLDIRTGYSLAPGNKIPQLDAIGHKTLVNELLFSSGMTEEASKENYPMLYPDRTEYNYIDYQHDTRWQDLIFSDASFRQINVGVKGGDEIARYGLSFGYVDGEGIIKKTGYQGYNIRFIGLMNIFSWLRMNTGVSLSYNNAQLKESGQVDQTSPILAGLGKSPMLNPFRYDNEGRELTILANVDELGVSNPQAIIDNYEAGNSNFNFNTTIGLEGTLREDLFLNSKFGISYNLLKESIFMPNLGMELYYNKEAYNVSKAASNKYNSFYNNTYLLYNKSFGKHSKLTSNTGIHIQTNQYEFDWALTKNSQLNDQYRLLQDGTNNLREIGGENRAWNWLSVYENVNYSYKDKYLLALTLSADGSSRVGDEAANTLMVGNIPFGIFYATGAGWRISEESFLKNSSWLEELKVRISYGRSGNDDIGETNASRNYAILRFRETTGLYPAIKSNAALTYETVDKINAGIDLAVLGSRIMAKIDAYQSVSSQLLVYTPIEAYFGYDFQPDNSGKIQNRGLDFNLFLRIIDNPNLKWDLQANYSILRNEILEIGGDRIVNNIQGAEIANIVGEQANSFYGYIFEGVFSSNTEAENMGYVNDKAMPYGGGDAIYADLSGPDGVPDKIINQYDKVVMGSPVPDHFGGITSRLGYKRWMFEVFVYGVGGNEVYNYIRYRNESMSGLENQSISVLNRWQYNGQETDVPRALLNDPIGNSAFSTRWIEDGSYLRIKNISLSYTIPDQFLAFRNAQFYVTASNLFTFSNYLGYDPEFSISRANVGQGIDYGLMPQARQFIVGIKLGL